MKHLIISILLIISVFVKAQETSLSEEEKIYGLTLIWQEVNYNFAYMHNYNLDWDSLYIAKIPKVIAAKNLTEYYSVLSNFINQFHEPYTQIELPEVVMNKYGRIPIKLAYTNGNYYVKGFPTEYKDKISIGSKLVSVNGYDVENYYNKFVFPKNNLPEQIAKRFLSRSAFFDGLLDEALSATFLNANGKTISLSINRIPYHTNDSDLIEVPEMYKDTVFFHKKYDDISYIRIGSFYNNTASTSFIKIIDSLKNSKAIIFDVRNNYGGNYQYATEIIKYFSDKKSIPLWWGEAKVNNSSCRAAGLYSPLQEDSLITADNKYYEDYATLSHYEGGQYNVPNNTNGELKDLKVVVLCNYETISAAESFIIQLKQVTSVTVIGEPTGGSISTALIVPLPGGGKVWIAAHKAHDENGQPYRYTTPDITYIPSIEDIKTGTDSVLKLAIDEINKKD